ncbi:MAG: ABC transporter permease [Bacteroidetes bacterium]|nr:MAG: ABC transporter permease [Bacteroidota bacterium]
MNFELFVAWRMHTGKRKTFSRSFVRIAIVSVALGVVMMILSDAILVGFQRAIRNKIAGFSGHIRVSPLAGNDSWEQQPVANYADWLAEIKASEGVRHAQVYATKAGIIQANSQVEGVVLKGVGADFSWDWFDDQMLEGASFRVSDTLKKSNAVLISKYLSNRLSLHLGDLVAVWFVNNNATTRGRRFVVSGIYETGLAEFDQLYALCDIRHIRKLNNWKEDQVAGVEVFATDFNAIDELNARIYQMLPYDLDARSIKDLYPQMFDWLALQDTNVVVIMVLMILVAGITMIATILILILERTRMIGVFKALGISNNSVSRIFIYHAIRIFGRGLLWGNVVALSLALIQRYTGLVTLPQESYYVSTVPIVIHYGHILLINVGTALICAAMLILPSRIIARIDPVKSIRME